jgi:hypothetical protein
MKTAAKPEGPAASAVAGMWVKKLPRNREMADGAFDD